MFNPRIQCFDDLDDDSFQSHSVSVDDSEFKPSQAPSPAAGYESNSGMSNVAGLPFRRSLRSQLSTRRLPRSGSHSDSGVATAHHSAETQDISALSIDVEDFAPLSPPPPALASNITDESRSSQANSWAGFGLTFVGLGTAAQSEVIQSVESTAVPVPCEPEANTTTPQSTLLGYSCNSGGLLETVSFASQQGRRNCFGSGHRSSIGSTSHLFQGFNQRTPVSTAGDGKRVSFLAAADVNRGPDSTADPHLKPEAQPIAVNSDRTMSSTTAAHTQFCPHPPSCPPSH